MKPAMYSYLRFENKLIFMDHIVSIERLNGQEAQSVIKLVNGQEILSLHTLEKWVELLYEPE